MPFGKPRHKFTAINIGGVKHFINNVEVQAYLARYQKALAQSNDGKARINEHRLYQLYQAV